jgi:hypothetical protein
LNTNSNRKQNQTGKKKEKALRLERLLVDCKKMNQKNNNGDSEYNKALF